MLNQIRKARQDESGFTLIELLIVIVVLGILAGIVVFAVSGITDRGQTSACKANYTTVRTAEEAYYAKNSAYATSLTDLKTGGFLASDTVPVTIGGTTAAYTLAGSGACASTPVA